jgi:hypothetical protein
MDEISMFTALRPPEPENADELARRAGARLQPVLSAPGGTSPGAAGPARRFLARRRPAVLAAGVLAAATGAAIVVPAVLPGGASGSFVTPAWAVHRKPDGTVTVTINKTLRDQAGLQRALRADGVPAYVRPGRCTWEPQGGLKQARQDWKALDYPAPGNNDRNFSEIVIHPAAIPSGDAVFIAGSPGWQRGTVVYLQSVQIFLMPNTRPPVCSA